MTEVREVREERRREGGGEDRERGPGPPFLTLALPLALALPLQLPRPLPQPQPHPPPPTCFRPGYRGGSAAVPVRWCRTTRWNRSPRSPRRRTRPGSSGCQSQPRPPLPAPPPRTVAALLKRRRAREYPKTKGGKVKKKGQERKSAAATQTKPLEVPVRLRREAYTTATPTATTETPPSRYQLHPPQYSGGYRQNPFLTFKKKICPMSYVELERGIPGRGSLDVSCEFTVRKCRRYVDPCPGDRATHQAVGRSCRSGCARHQVEHVMHCMRGVWVCRMRS